MRKSDLSLSYRYAGDLRGWTRVIAEVFQPQYTRPACAATYYGSVEQWRWRGVEITRYGSAPSLYERTERHIGTAVEDYFFMTLPRTAGARMSLAQNGCAATLNAGNMVLHHGAYAAKMGLSEMQLTALRIPGKALRERVNEPERHCIVALASDRSAGALFVAMLDALMVNAATLEQVAREQAVEHLYDLLALALDDRHREPPQSDAAARTGHLARALRHIAVNFRDPGLTPQAIADACHISLRYLHKIFAASALSVTEQIIETRLQEARRLLRAPAAAPGSAAKIAYACGFLDVSHFTRRFRVRFNMTPGEFRRSACG